jgi:hypothetical protein
MKADGCECVALIDAAEKMPTRATPPANQPHPISAELRVFSIIRSGY